MQAPNLTSLHHKAPWEETKDKEGHRCSPALSTLWESGMPADWSMGMVDPVSDSDLREKTKSF